MEEITNKLVADYVNADIPVIKEMIRKYGPTLYGLNQDEKTFILARTCDMLRGLNEAETHVGEHMYILWQKLEIELREREDMIGFVEVLAHDLLQATPVLVDEDS